MEYNLGKFLRRRYPGFIRKKYDPDDILITSSNFDRTLMSAQCLLAALYYPEKKFRFKDDLPWIPIPIYTSPRGKDSVSLYISVASLWQFL